MSNQKIIRKIAAVIFIDEKGDVVFQDRAGHSKDGEKFGLWGGGVEGNETPLEGLKRELIEELNYKPETITFWKKDLIDKPSLTLEIYLFVSPITETLLKCQFYEGSGIAKGNLFEINPSDFGEGADRLIQMLIEDFNNKKIIGLIKRKTKRD